MNESLAIFFYTMLLCLLDMPTFAEASPQWPIPASRLKCLTCIAEPGDTTQLDQFRVRQRLREPRCEMETVECAPQQDACVTVTMQVGPERFWIGSGCDQRVNYDVTADQDGGCTELQTFTRNFQPGYVEERPANQRVCLCTGQLCNGQSMLTSSSSCLLLGLAWILPRIFGLLRY